MLIAKAEKVRTFPHIAFTRISVGQYAIEGPFTQRTAAIKQDLPRVAWIFRPDYHPPCVGFTPHFRIAEVHDSFWWSEDHTLFLEMNTIPTGSQTLYFANCIVITCTIEIKERDDRDRNRAVAPLVPAADALVLDSTTLSIEQVIEKALQYARQKLALA